jgi:hypothetical protein
MSTRTKRSPITTEQLLVRPDGFGISTATHAQRAACRILDGRPLGELAEHPDVLELVGGPEALAVLPSERAELPVEVVFLASIRSAKTIIACAAALRATQTVDCSKLGPGEEPRLSLLSVKIDAAQVAHGLLLETIRASRVLRPLLIDEGADWLRVRHPSGRPIEIACVAGSKAGSGLVARWSAGVIFDEAPRMSGSDDAVVNLDHARSAVLGRLLPGAQALYIGSAWAPMGPVYELVTEHWQKPKEHIVVLRGTGPMLNPTWWTPERCARLQQQDPVAYQTDVMGEFADPESGLLSPISLRMNTREAPLELEPEVGATYAAAIDPAEGNAGANAWTLTIVQRLEVTKRTSYGEALEETRYRYRVALAREWRGMRPEQCLQEIAACCKRFGLERAATDQYAAAANADLARRFGLYLDVKPTTHSSKLEDFTNLATLVHSDCVELPPDPQLRRDLLNVKRRTTQQGVSIVLPRTGDGRHCDYAPALAGALRSAFTAADPNEPMVISIGSERSARGAGIFVGAHRMDSAEDYEQRRAEHRRRFLKDDLPRRNDRR